MIAKHFKTLFRLSIPVCLLVGLVLTAPGVTVRSAPAGTAAMVPAATIFVGTNADELDGFSGNGYCSLREAITNANNDNGNQADCAAGSGADTITLPAGTYTLTGAAGEDDNASGDLDIKGDLTINGVDAKTTVIQAGTSSPVGGSTCADCVDRVLHIHSGAAVEINSVTIRYGKTADGASGISGSDGDHGGGIYNASATLILNNCHVNQNRTGNGGDGSADFGGAGGYGGGIYNHHDGTLILNDTVVGNNETGAGGNSGAGAGNSGGAGGGIFSFSVMTLTNSAINYNTTGDGGDGGDVAGGDAVWGGEGGWGGGIYANASTTLIDSTVTGNTAGAGGDGGDVTGGDGDGGPGGSGGSGAGISAVGGATSLVVVGSTISDNETGPGGLGGTGSGTGSDGVVGSRGHGGGLDVYYSRVALHDSTLSGNTASFGGGIDNKLEAIVTLTNSTVSGNSVYESGGGIYSGSNSTVALTNSTVSDNRAHKHGGGIYNSGGATTTLIFVTVTDNTADLDNNGSGDGGGIAAFGPLTMTNTIVAKNYDMGGESPDCSGTVVSGDYNLLGIGDSAGCTFTPQPHDQVGTAASPVDPLLGLLSDNGGPTWTHALKPGSPAVDYIPEGVNGCVAGIHDQRGALRFPACNIGAFEQDQIESVYLPFVLKDSP